MGNTPVTWRRYIFRYKGSDKTAATIVATSYEQALFKLGLKKGHAWVKDSMEDGLIFFHSTELLPSPFGSKKKRRVEAFERVKAAGRDWWNR